MKRVLPVITILPVLFFAVQASPRCPNFGAPNEKTQVKHLTSGIEMNEQGEITFRGCPLSELRLVADMADIQISILRHHDNVRHSNNNSGIYADPIPFLGLGSIITSLQQDRKARNILIHIHLILLDNSFVHDKCQQTIPNSERNTWIDAYESLRESNDYLTVKFLRYHRQSINQANSRTIDIPTDLDEFTLCFQVVLPGNK